MSKLTFEQALRITLANSRLARILEDEDPAYWWHEALEEDRKDVELIIDKLCEDLSKLTGRSVRRFSKLMPSQVVLGLGMNAIDYAFDSLNKAIKQFIWHIMEQIKSGPRADSVITYPISKIWWEKTCARIIWPNTKGKTQNIKLHDPEQKELSEVNQPPHIRRLVKLHEDTHFDYQPYVLEDIYGCKILALKIGCDWHDLAIATWEPKPFLAGPTIIGLIALVCFAIMGFGLWFSSSLYWPFSVPIMLLSGVVGIVGGLLTTLLFALLYKPLKL